MRFLRKFIYELGFRPKFNSIFYSPSLHMIYTFTDWTKPFDEDE